MKRIIIVLLLVTILASLVTAGLIVNKKTELVKYYAENDSFNEKVDDAETTSKDKVILYKEYHLPINDDVKGSSSSQTFDINPIKFTEKTFVDEKMNAFYLQIDGLKNEDIEKTINNRLRQEIIQFGEYAYNKIKKAKPDEYVGFTKYNKNKPIYDEKIDSWNACVKESILYNGNNVLSIAITDYNNPYLNEYTSGRNRYLNFNLTNGKEIKIEELFTKDYSVADGFTKELYLQLGEGDIKWQEEYHINEETGEKEWWRI